MATSRGALNPRRTVPPRTSTTWTSMSSPMRIVSPTLRVSVSTGTPPWVCGGRPWRCGCTIPQPSGELSAQGPPDGMCGVREDDLAGPAGDRVDDHRGAEGGRGRRDVAVRDGDAAVERSPHRKSVV